MVKAQVPTNAPQVDPIDVHLQGLLTHCLRVTLAFRLWGVLLATVITAIALTA
jgi:hypothetical protein